MKTISDLEAQGDLKNVLDSAQEERVVITRDGKPAAVILGLESYDSEEMQLAGSPEFWTMIERRRRQGSAMTIGDAKARLKARERGL